MAPAQPMHGRTLGRYLLLPRPKDSVKWWIMPSTFAVGVLGVGGVSGHQLARAAVAWAALELLIYQARYQWNDIRGFRADQAHPDAPARGRLPGPVERARSRIAASAAVAVLRLAAAGAVAVALPQLHLVGTLALLAVGVFAVAAVYEALRTKATGRSGEVPVPLHPALVGLWIAVGGGYAVRGLAGLALALDIWSTPALAVAAGVTMWAYGVAFVTTRWAIEALPFAQLDGARIVWGAGRKHAREHVLGLVRWLPREVPPGRGGRQRMPLRRWAALRDPTPASAPWNLALLVAATAAGLAGPLLTSSGAGVLTGVAGSVLALAVTRSRAPWRGLVFALGVAAMCGLSAAAGVSRPALATVPWIGVVGSFVLWLGQTLDTMGRPVRARLVPWSVAITAALRPASPPRRRPIRP
jgi:hypothetical protein